MELVEVSQLLWFNLIGMRKFLDSSLYKGRLGILVDVYYDRSETSNGIVCKRNSENRKMSFSIEFLSPSTVISIFTEIFVLTYRAGLPYLFRRLLVLSHATAMQVWTCLPREREVS